MVKYLFMLVFLLSCRKNLVPFRNQNTDGYKLLTEKVDRQKKFSKNRYKVVTEKGKHLILPGYLLSDSITFYYKTKSKKKKK